MSANDFTIDAVHVGRPNYVAVHVLDTTAGPVLIDTGPGSTLPTVRAGLAARGIGVEDLHGILLSHIHLDHAGATGSLARDNPDLIVYVHELGATHMIDPSKLIASATRIYGDRMEVLWGEFLPVPADRVKVLRGGETISLGGRTFEVAHTPGHAIHHVGYFEPAEGIAYVGDTAGIRVPSLPYTLPVTPPPDFNLEQWRVSLDRIRAWKPKQLFRTHFGFSGTPEQELDELAQGLESWASGARQLLDQDLSDGDRADRFHQDVFRSLAGRAPEAAISDFASFSDFRASWYGLARYWKKK